MITKRQGFNNGANNKVIDLSYYQNTFVLDAHHREAVDQLDAEFIRFDWFNLNNFVATTPNASNAGIRAEGTTRCRIEAFKHDFNLNGWKMKHYPPVIDTDGKVREGRGRIIAAKENGEPWIPVAVFAYNDNSVRNTLANGLRANTTHDFAERNTPASFSGAALKAIRAGELKGDKASITSYLTDDCKMLNQWSWECGTPSRIINDVLREIATNNASLVTKDTQGWYDWAEDNLSEEDNKNLVILKVGNTATPNRAWCEHVLPKKLKGKEPPKFLLYTSSPSAETAHKDMEKFKKRLDAFYLAQYRMVNEDILDGALAKIQKQEDIQRLLNKKKGFSILGAVPQFDDIHDIYGSEVVSIADYLG